MFGQCNCKLMLALLCNIHLSYMRHLERAEVYLTIEKIYELTKYLSIIKRYFLPVET